MNAEASRFSVSFQVPGDAFQRMAQACCPQSGFIAAASSRVSGSRRSDQVRPGKIRRAGKRGLAVQLPVYVHVAVARYDRVRRLAEGSRAEHGLERELVKGIDAARAYDSELGELPILRAHH